MRAGNAHARAPPGCPRALRKRRCCTVVYSTGQGLAPIIRSGWVRRTSSLFLGRLWGTHGGNEDELLLRLGGKHETCRNMYTYLVAAAPEAIALSYAKAGPRALSEVRHTSQVSTLSTMIERRAGVGKARVPTTANDDFSSVARVVNRSSESKVLTKASLRYVLRLSRSLLLCLRTQSNADRLTQSAPTSKPMERRLW